MDLKFCARPHGLYIIVKLYGPLEAATAPRLGAFLMEALRCRGKHLIVDGSELSFLDICGLEVLLDVRGRALADGGSLRLAMPSAPGMVAAAPVVAQLYEQIPTYRTVEEAAHPADHAANSALPELAGVRTLSSHTGEPAPSPSPPAAATTAALPTVA